MACRMAAVRKSTFAFGLLAIVIETLGVAAVQFGTNIEHKRPV